MPSATAATGRHLRVSSTAGWIRRVQLGCPAAGLLSAVSRVVACRVTDRPLPPSQAPTPVQPGQPVWPSTLVSRRSACDRPASLWCHSDKSSPTKPPQTQAKPSATRSLCSPQPDPLKHSTSPPQPVPAPLRSAGTLRLPAHHSFSDWADALLLLPQTELLTERVTGLMPASCLAKRESRCDRTVREFTLSRLLC